jgi:hypothetical protein
MVNFRYHCVGNADSKSFGHAWPSHSYRLDIHNVFRDIFAEMRPIKFDQWVLWMYSENCNERTTYDQTTSSFRDYYLKNKKWLIIQYRNMLKDTKIKEEKKSRLNKIYDKKEK